MTEQRLMVVIAQDVENEAVSYLHEGFNRSVFGDGDGESGRAEAGLTHPAGHHGAASLGLARSLARCHHIKATTHPA